MRCLAVAVFGFLELTACGGESSGPTDSSDTVATTTEATPTTSVVSDEQLAAATAVGDMAKGEKLFNQPIDALPHSASCSTCHTLDGKPGRNPTMTGISAVAPYRVDGMADVDYLRQSILDPTAFKPSGNWNSASMPYQYPDLLSEDQINDLIAFLLTR